MSARILIVEDEPDMARVLQYNLRQAGYTTAVAHDAGTAIAEAAATTPDLVLLDWMLPDRPGTDVCRHLRQQEATAAVPVIMVSARGEEIDRVVGFELGVDDYVTKPFSVRELLLRIAAILRRKTGPATTQSGEFGPLRLDLAGYRVFLDGSEISLTDLEAKLLGVLAAARDRVVTREDLVRQVWGSDNGVTTAAVDSHVKRLRTKLGAGASVLKTVRGVGYTLSALNRPGTR